MTNDLRRVQKEIAQAALNHRYAAIWRAQQVKDTTAKRGRDADHTTDGFDCWCCPVYLDVDGQEIGRAAAEASDELVIVVHRSERRGANDVTGDIPWQT